eukprot:3653175-Rhodomonas_salina.2
MHENDFRKEERALQALPARKKATQVRNGLGPLESSGHDVAANGGSEGSGEAGETGAGIVAGITTGVTAGAGEGVGEEVGSGSFSHLRSSPFRGNSLIDSVRKVRHVSACNHLLWARCADTCAPRVTDAKDVVVRLKASRIGEGDHAR